MDANKSYFINLFWTSMAIILFSAAATVIIVAWSPMLPEAIAVSIHQNGVDDLLPYRVLHEAESWHYTVALNQPNSIAYCLK